MPEKPAFIQEQAWRSVCRNGLTIGFGKLLYRLRNHQRLGALPELAYYFNSRRRPSFCKESRFLDAGGDQVQVVTRPLVDDEQVQVGPFRHQPTADQAYIRMTIVR